MVITSTFNPNSVIKITTGDQTTTSNVAANVTDLVFSLQANSVYTIYGVLNFGCNNTGGVKFAATIPASTTISLWLNGRSANATSPVIVPIVASATLTVTAMCTLNGGGGCLIAGTITTGSTAGSFQFMFASGVNTETSTMKQEGTFMNISKVG